MQIVHRKALPMASEEENGQQRAAGRIVVFFLLMLALTLFARGMAGAALSQVTVASPQGRTVEETQEFSGQLESQSIQVLELPEGLTVQSVLVAQGQQVKKGDSLLTVDPAEIEGALTKAQGELDKLNLELAGYQEAQEVDRSGVDSAQTNYQRSQEDYQTSLSNQKKQVSRAKKDVEDASTKLSKANGDLREAKDEREKCQEAVSDQEEVLDDLQARLEEAKGQEEPDEAAIAQLEADIAAAQETLSGQQEQLAEREQAVSAAEDQRDAAQDQLDAAREALEDANDASSASKKEGSRSVADAKTALEQAQGEYSDAQKAADTQGKQNQAEAKILSVSIAEQEGKIENLNRLKKKKGVLTAPCDGTITVLNAEVGGTSDGAQVQMTTQSKGYVLTLEGEELKDWKVGTQVTVTQGEQTGETTIATLLPEEETDSYTAVAYVTGEGWQDGAAQAKLVKSSDYYEMTVPTNAYHSDNNGGFLYVIEEKQGVLGLEYVVQRENVTLKASDGEYVAVEGILSQDSQVVVSSNRSVQEGERVRFSA